jgi:molybdate transport system substrate-binding protein
MPVNVIALLCLLGMSLPLGADEIRLAVASNFVVPVKQIAERFEADSGHRVIISAASTGKLYAQIVNGAPFDLFLAANSREPQRLEAQDRIRPGSRYTYALGVLALWSPAAGSADAEASLAFVPAERQRVAIANPRTAPYGTAAEAVLQAWGQLDVLQGRLIRGENIAQAYHFVASGNAGFGFVALSQLLDPERPPAGRYWRIDPALYPPIRQQVVILKRAADQPAAAAFWRYLKSAAARERIRAFGYGLEQNG